jgi:hypothetical protein
MIRNLFRILGARSDILARNRHSSSAWHQKHGKVLLAVVACPTPAIDGQI